MMYTQAMYPLRATSVFLSLILCSQSLSAQWTAIKLHPDGWRSSEGFASGPGIQGGYLDNPNTRIPVIWSGSAGSSFNLAPIAGPPGQVNVIYGNQQGGEFALHAAIWAGTAESMVGLHPGKAYRKSWVTGMADGEQVGIAELQNFRLQAALWQGSSQSFTSLHPAAALESAASCTDGIRQGGVLTLGVQPNTSLHAVLWNGSAEDYIDLNPGPQYHSAITSMAADQQGGWYKPLIGGQRAAVWNGTPQSMVDLHPFSGGGSIILGTTGEVQVGWAGLPNASARAALWLGTPESYVDLNSFLPPQYPSGRASAVWQDGSTVYVVGMAYNTQLGYPEAWMWVGTVPAPGAAAMILLTPLLLARRKR
jgi:hypothetical protein